MVPIEELVLIYKALQSLALHSPTGLDLVGSSWEKLTVLSFSWVRRLRLMAVLVPWNGLAVESSVGFNHPSFWELLKLQIPPPKKKGGGIELSKQ